MAYKLYGLSIVQQEGSNNYYASWTDSYKSKSWYDTIENIKFVWKYRLTSDGIWYTDVTDTISKIYTTTSSKLYSPSNENAIEIIVYVKPMPKSKAKWKGVYNSKTKSLQEGPSAPSAPTVTIDETIPNMTMSLTNITTSGLTPARTPVYAKFYWGNVEEEAESETDWITIVNNRATATVKISAGIQYFTYAKLANANKILSDASSMTYTETAVIPSAPTNFTASPDGTTGGIKLTWTQVEDATGYVIEYCAGSERFASDEKKPVTISEQVGEWYLTLSTGTTYYFRIKATNGSYSSGWTKAGEGATTGKKPNAPTCWTLGTSFGVGTTVRLYFVHNTADGSTIRAAQYKYAINDGAYCSPISKTDYDPEEDPTIRYFDLALISPISDSDTISWMVQTKGVYNEYSDWSSPSEFTVYETPTLLLSMTTPVTSYPFSIGWVATPSSQTPVTLYLEIKNNNSYLTTDIYGEDKIVNANTVLYSKTIFTPGLTGSTSLKPTDIVLESGETYTLSATIEMNSGLRASATTTFTATLTEYSYSCDSGLEFFDKNYTVTLSPSATYDVVQSSGDEYVSNVTLTVYRINADGTFTTIAKNIANDGGRYVVDPHPTLGSVAYRILAINSTTGSISYDDVVSDSFSDAPIIITWDEQYDSFYAGDEFDYNDTNYLGTLLKLPYNVKVSESNSFDVTLQNYIGRTDPVSYYGTQTGFSGNTWSADIPKTDIETLSKLRRLAIWPGDVYVREPSGTGYWAQVAVSFNRDYNSLVIPVTLTVNRVSNDEA